MTVKELIKPLRRCHLDEDNEGQCAFNCYIFWYGSNNEARSPPFQPKRQMAEMYEKLCEQS
uniref:Uncharacterized protein n=1 Tax=Tetranychus urticae TaxID=32264 RepID=T1KGA8_TETUR